MHGIQQVGARYEGVVFEKIAHEAHIDGGTAEEGGHQARAQFEGILHVERNGEIMHPDELGRQAGVVLPGLVIIIETRLEGQACEGGEVELMGQPGVETAQGMGGQESGALRPPETGRGVAEIGVPFRLGGSGGPAQQRGGQHQDQLELSHGNLIYLLQN